MPLKTKEKAREAEKQRNRGAGNDEEGRLQTQLSLFNNDVKRLRDLVRLIDAYSASSKQDELVELSTLIAKLHSRMDERKQRLTEIQPELDSARNAVLDQERHKKQLRQNVDILEAKIRIKELDKEIARLEQDRDEIEGHETAQDNYLAAKTSKEKMHEDQARLDGRFSEIAESIRSLKVSVNKSDKLSLIHG